MVSFSDYAGNYLKGTDLQGREWLVTIDKIVEEDVGDSDKLVAHFVGRRKTLPLNQGPHRRPVAGLRREPGELQRPAGDPLSRAHPHPAGRAGDRRPDQAAAAAEPGGGTSVPAGLCGSPPAVDPEDEIPF